MKKRRAGFVVLVFGIILVFGYLLFTNLQRNKLASLEVDSNIQSAVFVDGNQVGMTPFMGTFPPREVVVKVGVYETRLTLQPGIKTIVNRNFSPDSANSYGETLSFEQTGLKGSVLSVVTDPGGANIFVDQKGYGISPLNIDNLVSGRHQLLVSMEGHKQTEFAINLVDDYKLTAFVDLEPGRQILHEASPTAQPVAADVFIKILTTPNGFLRVRSSPNTTSGEVARVHDGEKYVLISQDKSSGWYEIRVNATQSGWITDSYAAKPN